MFPFSEGVVISGLSAGLLVALMVLTNNPSSHVLGERRPRFPVLFEIFAVALWACAGMLVAYANESTAGPLPGTVAMTIGLGTPSFFMTAARELGRPAPKRRRRAPKPPES